MREERLLMPDINLAMDAMTGLIIMGFTLGVIILVITGAIRVGWMLGPYIFLAAMGVWLFGGF